MKVLYLPVGCPREEGRRMFLLAPFSYWSNEMSALPSCNVSFSRTSRLYATLPFQQPLGELGPKMASEWTGASSTSTCLLHPAALGPGWVRSRAPVWSLSTSRGVWCISDHRKRTGWERCCHVKPTSNIRVWQPLPEQLLQPCRWNSEMTGPPS